MRTTSKLLIAAALVYANSALAQAPAPVVVGTSVLRAPSLPERQQAWPMNSLAQGVQEGKATMACKVTARGLLDQCAITVEEPKGYGFGGALLSMAPLYLMNPRTVNGQPVDGGRAILSAHFVNPHYSAPRYGAVRQQFKIFSATWLRAPDADSFIAAFPQAAVGKVATGHVVLRCGFTEDGALSACSVLQEVPTGLGFGAAAKALSRDFRADVSQLGGHPPIDTIIDLPIHFMDPLSDAWRSRTVAQPVWVAAPGQDQVAAAYPVSARAAGLKTGVGRLDCMLLPGGKLGDCRVQGEDPANLGFGQAALKLAPAFAMNPWTTEGLPPQGVRIALPVRLSDNGATPATKP